MSRRNRKRNRQASDTPVLQWVFSVRDPMGEVNTYGFATPAKGHELHKAFLASGAYDCVTLPVPRRVFLPAETPRIPGA